MMIRACNVAMSVAGDVVYNDEYRRGSDTRNAITKLERGTDTVRLFGAYFICPVSKGSAQLFQHFRRALCVLAM